MGRSYAVSPRPVYRVELGRVFGPYGAAQAGKEGKNEDTHARRAGHCYDKELKKLADQKGVTLPSELDRSHARTRNRLAKLNGTEFDREYTKDMVKDHKKAVAEFQKESQKAKDADLKSWAGQTLPTLQDHLKSAQSLQASVPKK